MLIRKNRWMLVAALFVFAPMMGLVMGVFGGLQLLEHAGGEADDVVVIDSSDSSAETPASALPEVIFPGGEQVALDKLAPGQKLAVVVMKDPRCPVCQQQLDVLSERLDEIVARGGAVVGLSDAPESVNRRLMNHLELNFPIVSDIDHRVLERFGMTAPGRNHVMPGIIFIDEHGEVDLVHKGRAPGQQQAQQSMVLEWM